MAPTGNQLLLLGGNRTDGSKAEGREPTLRLHLWLEDGEGVFFGAGRAQLLAGIEEHGSLRKAAEDLGMSYRAAWGKIKKTEELLGVKLIVQNGCKRGGHHLTADGRQLKEKYFHWFNAVERAALDKAREIFPWLVKSYRDNTQGKGASGPDRGFPHVLPAVNADCGSRVEGECRSCRFSATRPRDSRKAACSIPNTNWPWKNFWKFMWTTPRMRITMRLPGDDINLVAGFCFTEGIIRSRDDLVSIEYCKSIGEERRILVRLKHDEAREAAWREKRREYLSKSSCGLCGKSEADEIFGDLHRVEEFHRVSVSDILAFKEVFESRQAVFPLTGGTHGASIFDHNGNALAFFEDIGRHNAFDKAIGALLLEGKLREAYLAIVSSRLSFEMVQKAGVLGLEVLAGLSAPTSMAVNMAEKLNITLIGFPSPKQHEHLHPPRTHPPFLKHNAPVRFRAGATFSILPTVSFARGNLPRPIYV